MEIPNSKELKLILPDSNRLVRVPQGCRHSSPSAKSTLPSSRPSIRPRQPCESLPEQQFLLAGVSHTNFFEGPETLMASHHGLYRHSPLIGSQIAKTQQNGGFLQIPAQSRHLQLHISKTTSVLLPSTILLSA